MKSTVKTVYISLFEEFRTHPMVRLNALSLFAVVLIDWMLMPLITKLEGTYLPVYMIGFFMLLSASDGIVQPIFKEVSLRYVYYASALLDTLQIFSYALFWLNTELFVYVILLIFVIQAVIFEIARIHTIDRFNLSVELKSFLILRTTVISGATIIGTLFTMVYDFFGGNPEYLFYLTGVLGIWGIVLQIRLGYLFGKIPPPQPPI